MFNCFFHREKEKEKEIVSVSVEQEIANSKSTIAKTNTPTADSTSLTESVAAHGTNHQTESIVKGNSKQQAANNQPAALTNITPVEVKAVAKTTANTPVAVQPKEIKVQNLFPIETKKVVKEDIQPQPQNTDNTISSSEPKESPIQCETPEALKQKPKTAPQGKRVVDPVVSSFPTKESITPTSYAHFSSTRHSRQVSQNDSALNPIVESIYPVKKVVAKVVAGTDADTVASPEFTTPRQKLNSPHKTTTTTRNVNAPHSERLHTEGNILFNTREENLFEFLESDPNLKSKAFFLPAALLIPSRKS